MSIPKRVYRAVLEKAIKDIAKTHRQLETRDRYICYVLANSRQYYHDKGMYLECDVTNRLQSLIHERLGNHHTLERWLKAHHNIEINTLKDLDKMQATRVAWLEALLKEFG